MIYAAAHKGTPSPGATSLARETTTMIRCLALLVFCAAVSWPCGANAQKEVRPAQIGFLLPGSQEAYSGYLSEFQEGLRELGYQEKTHYVLNVRWANGQLDQLPALAAELVASKIDVLVVSSAGAAIAAQKATDRIPIVQASGGDPVVSGLAATYARPQGNLTGISNLAEELSEKSLQLLLSFAPNVRRVGVLINPDNPAHQHRLVEIRRAGEILRAHAIALHAHQASFDDVFDTLMTDDIGGLIVLSDAAFLTERRKIIHHAARAQVPTIYQIREFVLDGGLMSYGINIGANYHRAATLVHRILRGAKPAELPVERPTRFEFGINLKAAQALGRKVPNLLLFRADFVIE